MEASYNTFVIIDGFTSPLNPLKYLLNTHHGTGTYEICEQVNSEQDIHSLSSWRRRGLRLQSGINHMLASCMHQCMMPGRSVQEHAGGESGGSAEGMLVQGIWPETVVREDPPEEVAFQPTSKDKKKDRKEGWWDSASGGRNCMHKSPEGEPSCVPPMHGTLSTASQKLCVPLRTFAASPATGSQGSSVQQCQGLCGPLGPTGTAGALGRCTVLVFGSSSKDATGVIHQVATVSGPSSLISGLVLPQGIS